jgi:hypothetical protein
MRREYLFFMQPAHRTHQLFFNELLEQAGGSTSRMICLVWSSSKPLIRIVGKCRPDAAILRQSSIPLIPGIQTSNCRHALMAGNSLASNSCAL